MADALLPAGPQLSTKYTLTGPDGTIATFNDPTDPNYVGAITEITGLDSPEVRDNGENLTATDGGINGNFYYGRRPITISGLIYNVISNEDRNKKITKLTQASNAMREDATLEWTPEGGERQFVKVRRQQPMRIAGAWAKTFQIALVASDPKIYSTAVNISSFNVNQIARENYVITGGNPGGVACDKEHIYWANPTTGYIGRSSIGGTSVEPTWVKTSGGPNGVAVDAGHVYWADSTTKTIGRCSLAGGTIEGSWIKLTTNVPISVAVDAGHVYFCCGPAAMTKIGRATIAGGSLEESWISTSKNPQGVGVDGTYVYWSNRGGNSIGRATLAGAAIEQEWISGLIEPAYVAVDKEAKALYWCSYYGGNVGRAQLNGAGPATNIEQNFAILNSGPYGVAVFEANPGVVLIASYNLGAISTVPRPSSELPYTITATNNGSEITYPVITVTGKLNKFSVVSKTTDEEIAINYSAQLPVTYSGGLNSGINFVANDGTYFYYTNGIENYGKISINGTGLATGSLLAPAFLGITGLCANTTNTFVLYKENIFGHNALIVEFNKYTGGYIRSVFEAESIVGLGCSETALFFGNTTVMQTCVLSGAGLTTIITGANVAAGTQIYVNGSTLYWTNTSGAIMKATTAGASVATVVAGPTYATSIVADATHLYWTATATGCIGRCTLAGAEVEKEWITGLSAPRGVFVNSERVYWANSLVGTLGYRNLEEPELTISIDTLNRTVTQSNGVSLYGSLNFSQTSWFGIAPGINQLGITASTAAEALTLKGTVAWRSAWI